jgi:hypothetical protein
MAREACGSYRLHWIDVIPWRNRSQHSFRYRKLLRARDVAFLAVPPISRVKDFIVVMRGVSKSIDGQVGFQFFSSVDLMNHGLLVNRFRWQLVSRTTSLVIPVGVMAHDAELHVLATASV